MRRAANRRSFNRTLTGIIAASLVAAGGCSRSEPMSLLIVTIDTCRADHLGCYGYFRDTSPTIDSLASASIFFECCLVPMATTLPSHLSLLTGLYPIEHGVVGNVGQGGRRYDPAPGAAPYAGVAAEAGYRTAAFVSAAPLDDATGISRGFDRFDEPEGAERNASETTDRVIAWLDSSPDEPFLLWVHYFDPHFPYAPPPPYDSLFMPGAELRAFLAARGVEAVQKAGGGAVRNCDATVSLYDGEIRFVDHQLSRLLARLRAGGLADRTAIVLAGDHGEGLGEHLKWGHGMTWDEDLHAPLMIAVPGIAPRRFVSAVSLVDALPMLLGECGRLPRGDFPGRVSGVDRLAARSSEPVFSMQSSRRTREQGSEAYSLTGYPWKYIYRSNGVEYLFDLERDPHEKTDLSRVHPEQVGRFRGDLEARLRRQREAARSLAGGDAAGGAGAATVDSARLEQLKALGYVD